MTDEMPEGPSLGPEPGPSDELGGGGEWPDPDAPPSSAAPGSDPARAEEIRERRASTVDDVYEGTSSSTSQRATDQAGETHPGQTGAARSEETDQGLAADVGPRESFKDVLDENPVQGGSGSIGEGMEDRHAGADEPS